eukprot:5252129-Amphidinium_carterae.1
MQGFTRQKSVMTHWACVAGPRLWATRRFKLVALTLLLLCDNCASFYREGFDYSRGSILYTSKSASAHSAARQASFRPLQHLQPGRPAPLVEAAQSDSEVSLLQRNGQHVMRAWRALVATADAERNGAYAW